MTTEAAGLEEVLFGIYHPQHDYAEANDWWREKCERDAEEVRTWLRAALTSPEVVAAAAEIVGINARATLTAAAETLRRSERREPA